MTSITPTPHSPRRNQTAIIALTALLLTAGCTNPAQQTTYATDTVARAEIAHAVTATGTVEPVTKVEVGTQVSGIIDKLYVDYNSTVKKGQLIAEMDRITLLSELSSRQAAYDGAKAEAVYQQKNYTRNNALHDKQLISDTDHELSLYNHQKAQSTLQSTKADLAKAQRNVSYTTITSPIDGVVINRAVEEGQTVAAGFSTPTLFTIAADLTQMQVVANVDEADIGGVEQGQRVMFTVDTYPNDQFEGEVTQVRLEATTTNNVVTYQVVISAHNPLLKLKPGLTANVNIYTVDKKDVLSVPSKALRFSPDTSSAAGTHLVQDCTGEHKLWTRHGNTLTAHPVEIGITNGTRTEITAGIAQGTLILTDATTGTPTANNAKQEADTGKETNPFMPTHPGGKKK